MSRTWDIPMGPPHPGVYYSPLRMGGTQPSLSPVHTQDLRWDSPLLAPGARAPGEVADVLPVFDAVLSVFDAVLPVSDDAVAVADDFDDDDAVTVADDFDDDDFEPSTTTTDGARTTHV